MFQANESSVALPAIEPPFAFASAYSLYSHRMKTHELTTLQRIPLFTCQHPSRSRHIPPPDPAHHPVILGDQLSKSSLPSPPPSNQMSVSERSASSGPPPAIIPDESRDIPSLPRRVSLQAKRGRDGYWQLVQDQVQEDEVVMNTPAPTGSGISLVFKMPPGSAVGGSRATSPASTAGSKTKRSMDGPINTSRSSRARGFSPNLAQSDPMSMETSPAPMRSHPNGSLPFEPTAGGAALSIFAPPPPSDALPEALQDVLGSTSSQERVRDEDMMMREAADGFDSRLRPTRGRDSGVRTGVSASGKGVKVGTAKVGTVAGPKKKPKGKAEVDVPNQDFCSACRGIGRFLCCDGCPRSFHFMCLEPPLRIDELPEEETWYCKKCRSERVRESPQDSPSRDIKPIPAVFKQLSKRLDEDNPVQFKLPQDVRQFFAGVATGPRGDYVDAEAARTKYDRKGFQEERDGTRLRDGKARPVACYACGGSSIPLRSLTTDPGSSWRQIVSCDYCALHWHLDCLDPPLASMPNSGRKWMCPNHAEQVMTRRRTLRNKLETVDVESQGQPNNGNIWVVPDGEARPIIEYEDLIINKRKYRVPEKIIRLDFWEKLGLGKGYVGVSYGCMAKLMEGFGRRTTAPAKSLGGGFRRRGESESSSLTSLESEPSEKPVLEPSQEDLEAANLILDLLHPHPPPTLNGTMADHPPPEHLQHPDPNAPRKIMLRVTKPSPIPFSRDAKRDRLNLTP